MFEIVVKSGTITARLDAILPAVRQAVLSAVNLDADRVLDRAKTLAGGDVLQVKSGKYLASIKSSVRSTQRSVYGKVYSRDPRAGLFEWGGTTPAREILPNKAKALAFMGSAGQVFAGAVHRPVVRYQPHSVIHEAFEEMKSDVTKDIEAAGRGAIAETL